jgi:hypothetical protein
LDKSKQPHQTVTVLTSYASPYAGDASALSPRKDIREAWLALTNGAVCLDLTLEDLRHAEPLELAEDCLSDDPEGQEAWEALSAHDQEGLARDLVDWCHEGLADALQAQREVIPDWADC